MNLLGLLACLVGSIGVEVMAALLLGIIGLYVLLGLIVALPFVLRGVNRVDPVAEDSSFVFRVMILPGCVGLWPVVLWKWIKSGKAAA